MFISAIKTKLTTLKNTTMNRHEELINEIHMARKRFEDSYRNISREDMDILLEELEIMSSELQALHREHRNLTA